MGRRPAAAGGGRGARWVLAGLAAVVAAGIVVVLVIGQGSGRSRGSHGDAGITGGTAIVARRNLVTTDTESGTVSYADPRTVYNRLGGTITSLPGVGQEIRPGGVLYRVADQPVVLMDGATPAYRALSAADSDGPDVLELNRNLRRLGFDAAAITVNDRWQPATSLGVLKLQRSLGVAATGTLLLGQVVFLPGRQLVTALDASVGSTAVGGGAQAILETSSTRLVVTVDLDASSQSEASVGKHVTVELPAGNTVGARIIAVSPVAHSASGNSPASGGGVGSGQGTSSSGSSSTVPVTIALTGRHRGRGLDQATVSVDFASERARSVLSVPVTALVATSGARYALQEASAPHRLIAVNPGLFAAGYVEVSGPGVHPGLAVTDSQG